MKLMRLTLDERVCNKGGPVWLNPMHIASCRTRRLEYMEPKEERVIGSEVYMDDSTAISCTSYSVTELPEEVARRFEEATR